VEPSIALFELETILDSIGRALYNMWSFHEKYIFHFDILCRAVHLNFEFEIWIDNVYTEWDITQAYI
jgi:hypothetical protein